MSAAESGRTIRSNKSAAAARLMPERQQSGLVAARLHTIPTPTLAATTGLSLNIEVASHGESACYRISASLIDC